MTSIPGALGYHLWLAPEGDAEQLLEGVIDRLAEAHGGPVFAPHVTLLSGLEGDEASLIDTNRKLAASLQSFTLELTEPETGATFFQCIYMRVGESLPLLQTRQTAGDAFAQSAAGYAPHLSLYYGDASAELRAAILETVPSQAKCRFSVESIQLIRADSERPVDWHCIDRAPLACG